MSKKGDNAKKALIDSLNGVLADHLALYMKTKNFHWHVSGPRFHDLHLLFDSQATQILSLTDIIGERVRKNGGDTLTSIGAISKKTRIKDQDSTSLSPEAMVKELRDDNVAMIAAIREAKAAAEEAGDNATVGISDDWTDQAEERVWFLDQIIK